MSALRFQRLPASHQSYGLVMSLLMEQGGYETARFGPLARAVAAQVRDGTHLAAFDGNRIVAYAGYLPVRQRAALDWLRGAGELDVVEESAAKSRTFTVSVACTTVPGAARDLLLAIRRLHPGADVVFRRDYAGGRARKSSVRVLAGIKPA